MKNCLISLNNFKYEIYETNIYLHELRYTFDQVRFNRPFRCDSQLNKNFVQHNIPSELCHTYGQRPQRLNTY
jgi:hypothetical protein